MKKYVSFVILIVLCIVCAMIFYANANDFIPNNSNNEGSGSTDTNTTSKPPVSSEDEIKTATIEKSGTFLSEYLTDTGLRVEWAILKLDKENAVYVSCELYLDSVSPITEACTGYLQVGDEKKEFSLAKAVNTTTLLTTITKSFEHTGDLSIEVNGNLNINISEASGVKLDKIGVNGTIFASEAYLNMPSSYEIALEHISQFPDLPSGDEVTSLAMVLKHLGYDVDKTELCDLYLDKGPVGFTDIYEANVGNPRNTHNSYGCMPPVIVNACNKFISVNGGKATAMNISGYNIDYILREVSLGNPVIVWACDDFDSTPSISRIWVVDGKSIYLRSGMATMVLVGYDLIENTVTLSNPAGNEFTMDLDLFFLRFAQMGSGAIVVK